MNHAPEFAEMYGCLTAFEMEDIEYLNYENKLLFFGASNKSSRREFTSEQVFFIFKRNGCIFFWVIGFLKVMIISDCKMF